METNKLRIKAVKTYQSVTFERKSVNYFSIVFIPNQPDLSIELLKDINAVEIKSDKDHVIIPLTNISAIHPWKDEDDDNLKAIEERKKLVVGIKASEIKRPK